MEFNQEAVYVFFSKAGFPLLKNLGTEVAHFVTVLEEGILFGPVDDLDIYVVCVAFETFGLPFFGKKFYLNDSKLFCLKLILSANFN